MKGKASAATGDASDDPENDDDATPSTPKPAATPKTPKKAATPKPKKTPATRTPASKKRKVDDVKMADAVADEEVKDKEMETPSESIFGTTEPGVGAADTEV